MTSPTQVQSVNQLAKVFSLSCNTIKWYLDSGMPGKTKAGHYDVAACLAWVQKNKLSKETGQLSNSGLAKSSKSDDREKWTKWDYEREKLRLQCEKMVFEFAEMRGEYLKRKDVLNALGRVREAEKQALYALASSVAVGYGEIGPALEKSITDGIDAILSRLHSGELY